MLACATPCATPEDRGPYAQLIAGPSLGFRDGDVDVFSPAVSRSDGVVTETADSADGLGVGGNGSRITPQVSLPRFNGRVSDKN